jgi:2-dehydro-3-deoxyphosphogluconate aldolase/(4S)-4-hydroxy-2-oxoglutarate aldolase
LACRQRNVPVFPGALSSTEIALAWELGANRVKVFPADALGPPGLAQLKASLPSIQMLPTGGVDLTSIPPYLAAGADGFGVGSPLFDRQRVEAGDWAWITARCRAFREVYSRARLAKLDRPLA